MANDEIWQSSEFRGRALLALLLIRVREFQNLSEEALGRPENSVEALLYRAGFSNKDIQLITGTAKSTVTDRIKAAGLP